MKSTKLLPTLLATSGLLVTGLAVAQPALAAARDGHCDSGEFCHYYNSDNAGSVSDFTSSIDDYGTSQPSCYDFKGSGNGKGVCVKNNAASVWNRTSKSVTVFYNSGYAGSTQTIAAGDKANLNSTLKNNNASHRIGAASGGGTAQTPRNDYDGNARGFAQNNCTSFAAWRVASRTSRTGFQNSYRGQVFGNAEHWDDAARAAGITVNKTPKVGAIAVNDIHVQSSSGIRYGHVAYINKVYSDGSFDVEEYNWNVSHGYGTRSHMRVSNVDPNFQWIIHF